MCEKLNLLCSCVGPISCGSVQFVAFCPPPTISSSPHRSAQTCSFSLSIPTASQHPHSFFLYQKLRSHMDFARSAPDMTSEELNAFTRKRVCSNDCALTLQWKKTDLSHFHPFHSWRLSSFVEAIFRWWAQSHFHPLLQVAIGLLMHATTQILRWHFLFQPTL